MARTFKKALKLYTTVAVVCFNAALLLLLVGLVWMWLHQPDDVPSRVLRDYGDKLPLVYPLMNATQISTLIQETWSRTPTYAPYIHFREVPFNGTYVNVDEHGFRRGTGSQDWPPTAKHIMFVFGGSTTFGYGLPDNETVPSSLQRQLGPDWAVYNFGQSNYYSTQEMLLFERLLQQGIKPDVAIFIDGMNDFVHADDQPAFSKSMQDMFEAGYVQKTVLRLARSLPIGMVAPENVLAQNSSATISSVVERYLRTMKITRAMGASNGVTTYFVWQPAPNYQYNVSYHLFYTGDWGQITTTRPGYALMDKVRSRNDLGNGFIWCADIQQNASEPLYVDMLHYGTNMSMMLAKCVSSSMSAS